ncbi:SDR family oxidoreductase [Streptomyces beihaiensis]|uniref:SDR family oxidoreductase n=1 Tax=Streptomyces beihaiensis TaxID=2984495 RepID=A0ABT3TNW1_9ACTN|nr:SDR family oxidoreductase [Streptomyces beihaiensis]MCX3058691.1 SDR family oxidoreductase [Streptomyces beihaiensis]
MNTAIAVIGGTGRVGRIVTRKLLDRGESVRVIGRSAERARRHLPPRAQFFLGDVRDPASLLTPLHGCSAVVYTVESGTDTTGPDSPQSTLHAGVINTLDALLRPDDPMPAQFVLVSQRHVTHSEHPMNAYGRMLDWRLAGENAVRASGLPYTIVRPGWLTDRTELADDGRVLLEQGDRRDGYVALQDVAEACVQALYCPSAQGLTFEMRGGAGAPPEDWEGLFGGLSADVPPQALALAPAPGPAPVRALA